MKKKIVVLDGHTTNPGDLSWEALERLGDLTVYQECTQADVLERCEDCHIVVTNKMRFRAEEFAQLPKLELICLLATGYDKIDIAAAREANVVVCNAPHYSSSSVAQHVFAMLLDAINKVGSHNQSVQNGDWVKQSWSYTIQPIRSLHGMVLGVVGYGAIGQEVALIANAFGMRVLANNRSQDTPNAEYADLSDLCRQSDVISIHTPLTDQTSAMWDRSFFQLMKEDVILINTSRGGVINESDLHRHLMDHPQSLALLDVLVVEPSGEDHPLIGLPNCVVTPHIAWANVHARRTLIDIVAENIKTYQEGSPVNQVS